MGYHPSRDNMHSNADNLDVDGISILISFLSYKNTAEAYIQEPVMRKHLFYTWSMVLMVISLAQAVVLGVC